MSFAVSATECGFFGFADAGIASRKLMRMSGRQRPRYVPACCLLQRKEVPGATVSSSGPSADVVIYNSPYDDGQIAPCVPAGPAFNRLLSCTRSIAREPLRFPNVITQTSEWHPVPVALAASSQSFGRTMCASRRRIVLLPGIGITLPPASARTPINNAARYAG